MKNISHFEVIALLLDIQYDDHKFEIFTCNVFFRHW